MNEEYLYRFDAVTGAQTGKLAEGVNSSFTSDLATDGSAVYLTGFGGAYRVNCK
jgi:hypothetical protein